MTIVASDSLSSTRDPRSLPSDMPLWPDLHLSKPMRSVRRYSSAQFMSTAKTSGMAFSPDEERVLFTSDASGILNAYEVFIGTRRPKQLTHSLTENIQSVSYFPNDNRILI